MYYVLFWLPAGVATALAVDVGLRAPGLDRWFALVAIVLAGVAAVAIGIHPATGVTAGKAVEGMAVIGFFGVLSPLGAFYFLGRALRPRRSTAFFVWAIAQVPLALLLFLVLLWGYALAQCGPDAYECPI